MKFKVVFTQHTIPSFLKKKICFFILVFSLYGWAIWIKNAYKQLLLFINIHDINMAAQINFMVVTI